MKRIITTALICMLLTVGGVCAQSNADVKGNSDGKTVTVRLDGFTAGEAVAARIKDENGVIRFEDEFYASENGEVTFTYTCNSPSGKYTAVFYEPEGENEAQTDFVFVSDDLMETMKHEFTIATDYNAYYNNYAKYLSVNTAEYEKLSDKAAALSGVSANTSGEITIETINFAFNGAVFCARVNETKSSDVLFELLNNESFEKELSISKGMPILNDVNVVNGVNEVVRSEVLKEFAGSGITSFAEFKDELILKLFTTAIEKADYYTEVRDILTSYKAANLVTVNLNKFASEKDKTLPYKNMVGKTYATYQAAADGFEGYKYSTNTTSSSSSSSSSSSGGGGGVSGIIGKLPTASNGESSEENASKGNNLKDISDVEWARKAIESLYEKKIMTGDGNGNFRPNDFILRGEMAKVICVYNGKNGSVKAIPFVDVSEGSWYYKYVSAAYHNGWFSGKTASNFEPDEGITREEMAVVIARLADFGEADMTSKFADDDQISSWAKESVYKLVNAGIISGRPNGEFAPQDKITRAEAAAMIYRLGGEK